MMRGVRDNRQIDMAIQKRARHVAPISSHDLNVDARVLGAKLSEERGKPVIGAVVFHGDPNDTVNARIHTPHFVFNEVQLAQEFLTEICQVFRRGRHAQPLMRALKKGRAQAPFGFLDAVG